jgi:hypothetical protein
MDLCHLEQQEEQSQQQREGQMKQNKHLPRKLLHLLNHKLEG